ncbi:hypothetical protein [Nostoc sp.]|nr:hypothetical protein [Nostoc sp.]
MSLSDLPRIIERLPSLLPLICVGTHKVISSKNLGVRILFDKVLAD